MTEMIRYLRRSFFVVLVISPLATWPIGYATADSEPLDQLRFPYFVDSIMVETGTVVGSNDVCLLSLGDANKLQIQSQNNGGERIVIVFFTSTDRSAFALRTFSNQDPIVTGQNPLLQRFFLIGN